MSESSADKQKPEGHSDPSLVSVAPSKDSKDSYESLDREERELYEARLKNIDRNSALLREAQTVVNNPDRIKSLREEVEDVRKKLMEHEERGRDIERRRAALSSKSSNGGVSLQGIAGWRPTDG